MKRLTAGAAIALALFIAVGAAAAQDVSKVLKGTWKGEVQVSQGQQPQGGGPQHESVRTLVIEDVKQQDGKYTAKAKFGTAQKLSPIDLKVETAGKDVVLRFETPARSVVKLTLKDNKSLVGSLALDGGGGKEFPFKLDKSK
jgi:hypothetical protein